MTREEKTSPCLDVAFEKSIKYVFCWTKTVYATSDILQLRSIYRSLLQFNPYRRSGDTENNMKEQRVIWIFRKVSGWLMLLFPCFGVYELEWWNILELIIFMSVRDATRYLSQRKITVQLRYIYGTPTYMDMVVSTFKGYRWAFNFKGYTWSVNIIGEWSAYIHRLRIWLHQPVYMSHCKLN